MAFEPLGGQNVHKMVKFRAAQANAGKARVPGVGTLLGMRHAR